MNTLQRFPTVTPFSISTILSNSELIIKECVTNKGLDCFEKFLDIKDTSKTCVFYIKTTIILYFVCFLAFAGCVITGVYCVVKWTDATT